MEGLVLSGEPAGSDHLRRACAFLLAKQNPNGGWGEDFTSCYNKAYARDGMTRFGSGGSGVVNTAWAMLALLAANCDDDEALRRGAAYLMSEQLPNGDWKQEGIAGVFNRACGISYTQVRRRAVCGVRRVWRGVWRGVCGAPCDAPCKARISYTHAR